VTQKPTPDPIGIPEHGVVLPEPPQEPAAPARVMSIHAHPDDQEFTVGATLAKWARAGSHIITVCITSGNGGSNQFTEPSMTRAALGPIREVEQRHACNVLGARDLEFLRYDDGMLEPTIALRRQLTRLIRRYRPDAIVCGDPTVRYYGNTYLNHPDHRAAASAALDAAFPSSGTRLIFPELLDEGLEPHPVHHIFIHGADHPDVFIDITETLPLKLAALREHHSQLGGRVDLTEMMTDWAREQGASHGILAETFKHMTLG